MAGDVTNLEMNNIFKGEIVRVTEFGAFVTMPKTSRHGLVHKSQMMASCRVDNPSDVVNKGQKVWCKVIKIEDDGKVGLSMKYVNQSNGKDLDKNNVQQGLDELRRAAGLPPEKPRIELGAILDTVCKKCGGKGHLSKDCFQVPGGKVYDLLPSDEEVVPVVESHKKEKKAKKRKKEKKSKKKRHKSSESSEDEHKVKRRRDEKSSFHRTDSHRSRKDHDERSDNRHRSRKDHDERSDNRHRSRKDHDERLDNRRPYR